MMSPFEHIWMNVASETITTGSKIKIFQILQANSENLQKTSECDADVKELCLIYLEIFVALITVYSVIRLNFPYVLILDHLRSLSLVDDKFMPLDSVRLNTSVTAIRMKNMSSGNPCPLEIQTESGELIEADHVIVTVSLGVLKKNMNRWFSPSLSQRKRDIIVSMGFGLIGKVVLHYEEPFWSNWKFDYVDGDLRTLALYGDEEADAKETDPEGRYVSLHSKLICYLQIQSHLRVLSTPRPRFRCTA